ncbi:uncharacterized protein LOC116011413 [Ipomoea triloba]|uniref:uncharacterized protein LOC116011413 n=1 Tax=Ipomoea triloba TaxID=35885 RepID=UPI00125CDA80|nr:uncharacterized protein LOC116011413 [Ipomoea triloba]
MASHDDVPSLANLTLADLDDDEGVYHQAQVHVEGVAVEVEFYIVGRLVTNKPTKFAFLKDTMASVWQPLMGMNARELQPHLYLFRFFHEKDVLRVMEDGPWSFEQSLLILKRVVPPEVPESVNLNSTDFWVQIHSLPVGLRSEAILSAMGNFIGSLVKTDERNFDGSMRSFFRIRVSINVTKPLRKGMRLKVENGDWVMVEFKYERLPTFCFLCGIIGHGEKFCPKSWEEVSTLVKPFGASLRAGSRRTTPTAGQRWFAPETTAERSLWKGPVVVGSDVAKGKSSMSVNEVSSMIVARNNVNTRGCSITETGLANDGGTTPIAMSKELTVFDHKRKRVDGESSEVGADMQVDIDSQTLSKNLLVAGAGVSQSRQSL